MTYLLDVNVLIALIDASHQDHVSAHRWFASIRDGGWATCPIVENGVVRILSHRGYPMEAVAGKPAAALTFLQRLFRFGAHEFWTDRISLASHDGIDPDRIISSADLTDIYLLALASAQGGRFATFDRRLRTDAVFRGADALYIIT